MRLREDGITWQEIDGELVVLDLVASTYLTTNATGAFVTKLLQQDRTEAEVGEAMVAEFGIPQDVAARDAAAFLDALRSRGLLVED